MSGSTTFPPEAPTGLTGTIPSYLYYEYNDDTACQQLVDAQNALTQAFVTWFSTIGLPVYTQLTGDLLDWVAAGVYGIWRPTLTSGSQNVVGPYNTMPWNFMALNQREAFTQSVFVPVTDDIFKRIITWNFYKGDGFQYNTEWLKRRVHRWLNGPNGIAPAAQDNTIDVSVQYQAGRVIAIYLENTQPAQILQTAMANGILNVPFQYTYTFTLQVSLSNNGGLVQLLIQPPVPYPTSPGGLSAGGLWDDGGLIAIVGPTTPNPTAPPVFLAFITAAQLAALGGANLPHAPGASGQLWNDGGFVAVS